MATPAPTTLAELLPKDASGDDQNKQVFRPEWNLVLLAVQGLAVVHPELAATVTALQEAVAAIPPLVNGAYDPDLVPFLREADRPGLHQEINLWAGTPAGIAAIKAALAS